jgi:hypothetical protein
MKLGHRPFHLDGSFWPKGTRQSENSHDFESMRCLQLNSHILATKIGSLLSCRFGLRLYGLGVFEILFLLQLGSQPAK